MKKPTPKENIFVNKLIAAKSLKLRNLAIALDVCYWKYRHVDHEKNYQTFHDIQSVSEMLRSDESFNESFDKYYERLYSSIEKYTGQDLRDHPNCFEFLKGALRRINIRNDYCMQQYGHLCLVLHMAAASMLMNTWKDKDVMMFFHLEQNLRTKADHAIGYWTCRMHSLQDAQSSRGKDKKNKGKRVLMTAAKEFLRQNRNLLTQKPKAVVVAFFEAYQSRYEKFMSVIMDDGGEHLIACDVDEKIYITKKIINDDERTYFDPVTSNEFLKRYIPKAQREILADK